MTSDSVWAQASPAGVTGYATTSETNATYGMYFTVTQTVESTLIWFWSPSGATHLPSWAGIYQATTVAAGTLLAGQASPSWSGAAGSGWVSTPMTGVLLTTGNIYIACYGVGGTAITQGYIFSGSSRFGTTGANGLITAPTTEFTVHNGPYNNGSAIPTYPGTTNSSNLNWNVDITVQTIQTGTATPAAAGVVSTDLTIEPAATLAAAGLISAGPIRLFEEVSGPSTATANTTNETVGVLFQVTQGGMWFQGYWWWLCPTPGTQTTTGVKFALWNWGTPNGVVAAPTLVSGSTVTSGALTSGWNFVPLATPIQISIGQPYTAAVGIPGTGLPSTASQWKSGEPLAAGITPSPGYLSAYSGTTGSNPDPYGLGQGFSNTGGDDPAVDVPAQVGGDDHNYWLDVQVSVFPPEPYYGTYRLWPNGGVDAYTVSDAAIDYVIGQEIRFSQYVNVNKFWWYSSNLSGNNQLPTSIDIWSVNTADNRSGSNVYTNSSISWSGAAGSGWVSCTLTNVVLAPGAYRFSAYNNAGSPNPGWSVKRLGYWGNDTLGDPVVTTTGIISGPMFCPATTLASTCYEYDVSGSGNTPPYSYSDGRSEAGQSPFSQTGSDTYPNLYVDGLFQNYWVDAEVTPIPAGIAMLTAAGAVSAAAGLEISGTATVAAAGAVTTGSAQEAAASPAAAGAVAAPDSAVSAGATLAAAGAIAAPDSVLGAAATLAAASAVVPADSRTGSSAALAAAGAVTAAPGGQGAAAMAGAGTVAAPDSSAAAPAVLAAAGAVSASPSGGSTADGTAVLAAAGVVSAAGVTGASATLDAAGVVSETQETPGQITASAGPSASLTASTAAAAAGFTTASSATAVLAAATT